MPWYWRDAPAWGASAAAAMPDKALHHADAGLMIPLVWPNGCQRKRCGIGQTWILRHSVRLSNSSTKA